MFKRVIARSIKARRVPRRMTSNVPETELDIALDNLLTLNERSQFCKDRLTDFGELPRGQVPEALFVSPSWKQSQLDNQVRVFTENYPESLTVVSVFIKAGSRFETVESSGASHFLGHMIQKGPGTMTRELFEQKLQELGTHIDFSPGRELIGFSMRVCKEDVRDALSLLLEAITSPNLDGNQIEAEKELVHRKIMDVSRDQFEFAKESLFYTSFRDHMMGQSQYGIRDNVPFISPEHLSNFHKDYFAGENIAVVVTGEVNHAEIEAVAQKRVEGLPSKATANPQNLEKPLLTGSVMSVRDEEMANMNVAIAYLAPTYGDPDFFSIRLIEKMVGEYEADKHGVSHVNTPDRQYNSMHAFLGGLVGITLQQTKHYGFSDFGLLTATIQGNDFWGKQLMYCNQYVLSRFALELNQVEVFRARAKLFNELLEQRPSKCLNEEIARELFYIGRRLTRTEVAYRYSNVAEHKYLKEIAFNWLYDKDLGAVFWGPLHNVIGGAYYDTRMMSTTKADIINMIKV